MTESQAYLLKVQTKLSAVSARETVLIQALGKALSEADHCLLDDVRALTIEHETRRTMIRSELQNLAARIRTSPIGERDMGALVYEPLGPPYKAIEEVERPAAEPRLMNDGVALPSLPEAASQWPEKGGGDWREALANLRKAG